MRKAYLALLVVTLCLAETGRGEDKDLLALTTNFGPSRKSATSSQQETGGPRGARSITEESVRRQESQIVAQQLIGDGIKLYYDAKYEAAIAKFEQAIKVLPRADATQVDYDRAVRGLSDCYERMADAALRAGDKEKAVQYARKALEYQPNNRAAENIVVKLKLGDQDTASKAERAKRSDAKPKPPVQRLDRTPEFKAKQEEVRKLFREARILTSSGQHDEAEKRYKQILLIDHYNEDAYKNLQELNTLRSQAAHEGVSVTRRQRLWQVAEAWIPSVSGEVKLPEKASAPTVIAVPAEKEKIERKLRTIRFPEINFRDAAIVDVVKFLSEESAKLDPDTPKEGVNIVFGPGVGAGAPSAPVPSPEAVPGAIPPPAPMSGGGKTITLSLHNVAMNQALKYVCQLSGLRSRVEASAVVLLPEGAVEGEMVTRPYNVSPDAIRSLISGASGAAAPAPLPGGVPPVSPVPGAPSPVGGAAAAGMEDLKTFFTNAGVPFPPGSSLTYFERARTIYVRNTPSNLEIFERVLATFNVVPSQVEIEAKFIEITQSDLDELGFQWNLGAMNLNNNARATSFGSLSGGGPSLGFPIGDGNATNIVGWLTQGLRGTSIFRGNTIDALLVGGSTVNAVVDSVASFQGVLNNAQFTMVVNALAQKRSADVLSAPKVTTISGAQAQIRVVQEFIYPSEYSQPTISGDSDGTPPTPSFPTAFKTREVGVLLSVTPTVGSDGSTINLTLVPEVSAFIGMLDYSPSLKPNPASDIATNRQDRVAYKIWQPLFETRNVTTSVVIWDGQTVVLGGLIREVVDKVDDKVPFLGDIPFLGRLFRQKIHQRAKRNLLVFVTARMIDPSGNLIHRPDGPGFHFDPMGNVMSSSGRLP